MTTHCLVLDTIVEKVQDFVDAFTLHIEKVLYCVHIVLVPLELEAFVTPHHVEHHLALLCRFEHVTIQQIVDLFVVQLQERYIDGDSSIVCHL